MIKTTSHPHPTPSKQVPRTAHELVCETLWSGYGWGHGQVNGGAFDKSLGGVDSASGACRAAHSGVHVVLLEGRNSKVQYTIELWSGGD